MRYAILIDGGFLKRKLASKLQRAPFAEDVRSYVEELQRHQEIDSASPFRVYYYDAPPAVRQLKHPLTGQLVNLQQTEVARQQQKLLSQLELLPFFAVRRGTANVVGKGWTLSNQVIRKAVQRPAQAITLSPDDFVYNINQKGVDMKVGLDIAALASKRIVDILVLVAGDSDFIPAMKFARKEGVQVFLDTLGHGVTPELKVHADVVLG